jgi:hypothetical protein
MNSRLLAGELQESAGETATAENRAALGPPRRGRRYASSFQGERISRLRSLLPSSAFCPVNR